MNDFSKTMTLIRRELAMYAFSPIPYVFVCVFLILCAVMTFVMGKFFDGGEASLGPAFFVWLPWLFLVLAPALGMRLWAEELQSGTIELLVTYPIELWHAVVAKFVAATAVLWGALVLTFPIPLTVSYLGDPDWGALLGGYLGAALMSATYLGVAGVASAASSNQIIAFILSVVVGALLILMGYNPMTEFLIKQFPDLGWLVDAVGAMGITTHFAGFTHGIVRLSDCFYFVSIALFSMYLSCVILHYRKQ